MSDALRRVVALSGDFESKARDLITVTRMCSVPQLLSLRRMTLDDANTRKWASINQIKVIFNVVLTSKLQALGGARLRQTQQANFEDLLPPLSEGYGEDLREVDRETLALGVTQALASVFNKEAMATLVAVRHVVAHGGDFEAKARDLISLTQASTIPQVLSLRHLTLDDEETLKWASSNQVKVIYNVALTSKLQEMGAEALREAQEDDFESLLPPLGDGYGEEVREEDRETLAHGATQALASMLHTETIDALEAQAPAPPPKPQPKAPAKKAEPKQPASPSRPVTFEEVFDDTICKHIRKSLSILEIGDAKGKSAVGLPFMVAPGFGPSVEKAMRAFVLPTMRRTRTVRTMSENYNWQESGPDTILEIIASGEVNNPILHAWDSRWSDFRSASPSAASSGEKKGLLGGLTKSATGKAGGKADDDGTRLWAQLAKDAAQGKYLAPTAKDLVIFQTLIRYSPGPFVKALAECDDLYAQEFDPREGQEPGREGSFRDGLNKWHKKLPPHIGEFVAIKLYYTYPDLKLDFLKNLSRSHGKSDNERVRTIPYLMAFLEKQGVKT